MSSNPKRNPIWVKYCKKKKLLFIHSVKLDFNVKMEKEKSQWKAHYNKFMILQLGITITSQLIHNRFIVRSIASDNLQLFKISCNSISKKIDINKLQHVWTSCTNHIGLLVFHFQLIEEVYWHNRPTWTIIHPFSIHPFFSR
jgi:hypothetical protein